MTGTFSAEARLIHAGTERVPGQPATPPLARWPAETAPDGLIRLSVGVEPAADLITDIDQALEVP